jgi:hypothetical protein
MALSVDLPAWLRASIEDEERQRMRRAQVENTPGSSFSPPASSEISFRSNFGGGTMGKLPAFTSPDNKPGSTDAGLDTLYSLSRPQGLPSVPSSAMPPGAGASMPAQERPSLGSLIKKNPLDFLALAAGAIASTTSRDPSYLQNTVEGLRLKTERDRWDSALESLKARGGVPLPLIDAARMAGRERGSTMLGQFLANTARAPELVNITDTKDGRTFATTQQEAAKLTTANPQRYALAGAMSSSGRGNYINMIKADGSGAPVSVLEGSPQHQEAVARGMVEAGPLSLNSRDPVRDRRVDEYQKYYGVDRPTAMKLADGLIKSYTDPLTGQTSFVDMVALSRGQGAGAMPTPAPAQPFVPPPAPMPPAPVPQPGPMAASSAPPPVPGRGVMPGEAAPRSAPDPMNTPLLGLVNVFGGKEPIQGALGKFTLGAYDPGQGVNVPLQRYQLLKQDIFDMGGGADRMSNQDRERIEKAFPSDGVFESPARAFDMLQTFAVEAQNTIRSQGAIAADTSKSAQVRREAEGKVIAAQKVLRTIGDPQQFSRPGSRGGQLAKPISQMSLQDLDSLDERTLSSSQLFEAAQRERALRGGK